MGTFKSNQHNRKIIGISISPEMAADVKMEAAKRSVSLRKLFEEMWTDYQTKNKD